MDGLRTSAGVQWSAKLNSVSNNDFRKIFIGSHNFIKKTPGVIKLKLYWNVNILRHHHNQEKMQADPVKSKTEQDLWTYVQQLYNC